MSAPRDFQERFLTASQKNGEHVGAEDQGKNPRSRSTNSSDRKLRSSSNSPEPVQHLFGAYIRLSPSDEIRGEGSLVSHPQRIQQYVDVRNAQQPSWGRIVEWYTDKDMSGKDMNRPAFKQMLQDIRSGRINAVVVTELSRLSRDVKDFCQFWEFLKQHRATFFSLKENFDTSTPIGEMMVIQCISFAQFERKTIVQRIKDGARARAERGLANGGQRLGFDLDPTRRCHLVVNPGEAAIVRMIFEQFVRLGSISKLRKFLNESKDRTKRYTTRDGRQSGGKVWTESSLYNLLTNCAFIGKREINKKNRFTAPEELKENERYKVVGATWPAIVDEALFWRVQDIMVQNRSYLRTHEHIFRLTGLVDCTICGEGLVGKGATGRGGRYYYYGHNRKFTTNGAQGRRCPLERIPAVRLEEAVVNRLIELAGNRKLLAQLAADSSKGSGNRRVELDHLIAAAEQDRRNAQREVDNVTAAIASMPEGLNLSSIWEKLKDAEGRRDDAVERINSHKTEREHAHSNVIQAEQVFKLFRHFQADFPSQTIVRQRELMREVVYKVRVEEDGVHVLYYSAPNEELIKKDPAGKLLAGSDLFFSETQNSNNFEKVSRTLVLPAFKLVETEGIEPSSESHPSLASTCVDCGLDWPVDVHRQTSLGLRRQLFRPFTVCEGWRLAC